MTRIAMLGGSGFLGRSVCERLTRVGGGDVIVVPTRRLAHAQALRLLPTVEVVEADVHDDRALASVIAGCDAVVSLVAILHGDEAGFERVHVALPRRLTTACRAAGVRRVVHVSALGVAPDAPSMYLRSKARGEAALREAGLDLTVVRPSVIFGAADRFLNLFATLQSVFPVMPLAGANARFQPVWVEDVADAVVRCLRRRDTIAQTFEAAGPEVFTLAELVRLAGRWSGHERPIVPLPAPLARVQALAMECLPGAPLMSRDNLDSMRVDNVAVGALPGLASLGIVPTAVGSVAPGYLGRSDGRARLDILRANAHR
jgi:NADH dehydrogenase